MQPITAGFTSRICSFMLPPALLPLLTATRLCNSSLEFWYGALFLFGVIFDYTFGSLKSQLAILVETGYGNYRRNCQNVCQPIF